MVRTHPFMGAGIGVWFVAWAMLSAGSSFAGGGTDPALNDPAAYDAAARQVAACLHMATKPKELRFGGVGVLWLTGRPDVWSPRHMELVKRWAARGHVCWIDVGLSTRLGVSDATGGGEDEAIVAQGAMKHPLVEGVSRIACLDTFRYMRGVPTGAVPIMTMWNREDHVVVACWELGRGLIIFRPQARPPQVTWMRRGERRWIEPDVADGARLLHNLNVFTLETLRSEGFPIPAPRLDGPLPPWPVL